MKHTRETTTSTDLLIESGEDHPEGQFLVDCSCGEEYYVKPIEGVTEFESLEAGQREHIMRKECPPLHTLTLLAKSMSRYDVAKAAQVPWGWLDIPQAAITLHGEIEKIYAQIMAMQAEHEQAVEDWQRNNEQVLADSVRLAKRIELLNADLRNARESAAANTKLLEIELVTLSRRATYQGSGVLDPLTRLIMVAEELDIDAEVEKLEAGRYTTHSLDETAQVLREVYGDLKRVLDTVHPNSAYVGDRIRASWEIWDGGTFVEKVTHEGVVVHAKVPGTNFVTFVDEDGVRHGPMVHNYEVIERFKPKDEN